jgi:hypothetical protein
MDKTWTDEDAGTLGIPLQRLSGLANDERLVDRSGLRVSLSGEVLTLHQHPQQQRVMAFPVVAIAGVFALAALLLPDQIPSVWLFRLVFATFTAALLLVALYLPFSSLEVRVSRQAVTRLRLWFGVEINRQQVRPQQVRGLEIAAIAGNSLPAGLAHSYRLVASGDFGCMRLLDGISDRLLMEALRAQIISAAGLSRERVAAG